MGSPELRPCVDGFRGLAVGFEVQELSFLLGDGYVHDDRLVDQWPEHVIHFFTHGNDAKWKPSKKAMPNWPKDTG